MKSLKIVFIGLFFISGCCFTNKGGQPIFNPVMISFPIEERRIEIILSIQDDGTVSIASNDKDVYIKSLSVRPYVSGDAEVSFRSDGELILNDTSVDSAIFNKSGKELWIARDRFFAGLLIQTCGQNRVVPTHTKKVRLPVMVRDVKCVRCDVRLECGSGHKDLSIYAISRLICEPEPLLLF